MKSNVIRDFLAQIEVEDPSVSARNSVASSRPSASRSKGGGKEEAKQTTDKSVASSFRPLRDSKRHIRSYECEVESQLRYFHWSLIFDFSPVCQKSRLALEDEALWTDGPQLDSIMKNLPLLSPRVVFFPSSFYSARPGSTRSLKKTPFKAAEAAAAAVSVRRQTSVRSARNSPGLGDDRVSAPTMFLLRLGLGLISGVSQTPLTPFTCL